MVMAITRAPATARCSPPIETIAIMKVRYGADCAKSFDTPLMARQTVNGVSVRLVPAGHILGSAQIVVEWQGTRAVVSGDYKRSPDPTCAPFELVTCDLFVTEATFGLPVFRHEPAEKEARRLIASMAANPERTHLLGAYNLGKCQRMIALVRAGGLRPADLSAWRTAQPVRSLCRGSASILEICAMCMRVDAGRVERRARAMPAVALSATAGRGVLPIP